MKEPNKKTSSPINELLAYNSPTSGENKMLLIGGFMFKYLWRPKPFKNNTLRLRSQ